MSKDLARAADRSSSGSSSSSGGGTPACPFALVVKALSKHDAEGLGFVKVILRLPGLFEWGLATVGVGLKEEDPRVGLGLRQEGSLGWACASK